MMLGMSVGEQQWGPHLDVISGNFSSESTEH